MSHTRYNQVYDRNGNVIHEEQVIIDDATVFAEDAPARARTSYADLRTLRDAARADRDAITNQTTAAQVRDIVKRTNARQVRLARALLNLQLAAGLDDGSYAAGDAAID